MRHLGSLALSLVAGIVVYVLLAISNARWVESTSDSGSDRRALMIALVAALVGGLVYAGLVLLRLSPVGTVITGLAWLGVGLWSMFAAGSFDDIVPEKLFGQPFRLAGPIHLLFAVPLVLTVFSPRRWRRWPDAQAEVASEPNYYAPPPIPSYDQPLSYSPVTPTYGAPEPTWPGDPYATDDTETTRRT